MGKFNSLLKTNFSKKKYFYDYSKLFKKIRSSSSVDYEYFENAHVQELLKSHPKYDKDLITLWGMLEMRSCIDYELGNTVNLYFVNGYKRIPVNQLEDYNYMNEDTRRLNLLDIKYCKHINLENVELKNVFLATYEIMDNNKQFRPYVLLFIKDLDSNSFVEIGYGYDSNDNGNVELFIDSFNYPVFLTPKGLILLPLKNKKIKFDVYDYISDEDLKKEV